MVESKSSHWWKDLCSICKVNNYSNWFDRRIRWKHGNGGTIKFWEDYWVGDRPLKESFPRLYSVSDSKEMAVSEMGDWISNKNREEFIWMLLWRRELFVWEQGLKRQLMSEISIV